MNSELLISIAVQIPVVALFAWFVLKLNREHLAHIDKRDEEWRVFLQNTQQQYSEILNNMTKAMEKVTQQVAKNTIAMLVHDSTVRGKNPDTMGSTEEMLKKILECK